MQNVLLGRGSEWYANFKYTLLTPVRVSTYLPANHIPLVPWHKSSTILQSATVVSRSRFCPQLTAAASEWYEWQGSIYYMCKPAGCFGEFRPNLVKIWRENCWFMAVDARAWIRECKPKYMSFCWRFEEENGLTVVLRSVEDWGDWAWQSLA